MCLRELRQHPALGRQVRPRAASSPGEISAKIARVASSSCKRNVGEYPLVPRRVPELIARRTLSTVVGLRLYRPRSWARTAVSLALCKHIHSAVCLRTAEFYSKQCTACTNVQRKAARIWTSTRCPQTVNAIILVPPPSIQPSDFSLNSYGRADDCVKAVPETPCGHPAAQHAPTGFAALRCRNRRYPSHRYTATHSIRRAPRPRSRRIGSNIGGSRIKDRAGTRYVCLETRPCRNIG